MGSEQLRTWQKMMQGFLQKTAYDGEQVWRLEKMQQDWESSCKIGCKTQQRAMESHKAPLEFQLLISWI
jgi:hypothetical protein